LAGTEASRLASKQEAARKVVVLFIFFLLLRVINLMMQR
jgi:hypothetical protein